MCFCSLSSGDWYQGSSLLIPLWPCPSPLGFRQHDSHTAKDIVPSQSSLIYFWLFLFAKKISPVFQALYFSALWLFPTTPFVDIERMWWGPAACCSKANKQARLVERKVCFISGAGSWGVGRAYVYLRANSPPPSTGNQWGKSFYRQKEGAPRRNSTVRA